MEEITNKIIGDFELLSVIGDGAQGRVYKACATIDTASGVAKGDMVALKVVNIAGEDENLRRKFKEQTDILRRLSHESIVKYIDSFVWHSGDLDECQCLVMEYLEGEDLTCRIKNMGAGLAWPQVEDIFEKCLAGLIHARGCGITHRDLKPSNIYLTKDGKVKLIDFDIARRDDSEQLSTAGWKGTFDYMAPDFITEEGFRGDETSDIFSLGVCFYQALTGKLPYEPLGSNAHIGYVNRWHAASSKPPSFRVGVFRVLAGAKPFVSKALTVKRSQRYQTFGEMLEDFRKIHYRVVRHKGKNDYELLALLGRGGFGEVFKARCSSDGSLVAVKHLFSSKQSGRFVKEAKILQRYSHENLVKYVDFLSQDTNTGDKQFFLVMEYLEGMPGWTLRLRVKNEGRLGTDECIKLFKIYLDALHFMHSNARPIIHRDIKPGNLYAPVGRPENGKIFDMGVARDVSGTVTTGGVPGTLDYMAPEFAESTGDRGSPQSDIYALGLCFYEALTGKPPYERLPKDINSAWTGFITRVKAPPPISFEDHLFSEFPRLIDIVKKSLALKPADRYKSAQAMVIDLDTALAPPVVNLDEEDIFDDIDVTMATSPGGADVTMGTRPMEGDINDYLNQIGSSGKKDVAKKKITKPKLILRVTTGVFVLLIAAGALWLAIEVLTGKGKKTIDPQQKNPAIVIDVTPTNNLNNMVAMEPEIKIVPEPVKAPVKVPEKVPVKAPEIKTTPDVIVPPVTVPEKVPEVEPPPPEPKVVAAADYEAAKKIAALMPSEITDKKSVVDANRAMLFLMENKDKQWKDVTAADKKKFIQDNQLALSSQFEAYLKQTTDRIVELSQAGKNTESLYGPLQKLKDDAPLLVEQSSKIYRDCCASADDAIKKKLFADAIAGVTAKAVDAKDPVVMESVVASHRKLAAMPGAILDAGQVAQFNKITTARYKLFADNQFKEFKAACVSDDLSKASQIKDAFVVWSTPVSVEHGQAELARMAKTFDQYYQQTEIRKKASETQKATIVNKTHPAKDKDKRPALTMTDETNSTAVDAKSFIKISVSPAKATVKIDDREVQAGIIEVTPGKNHRVEISCSGYKTVKQFYKVSAGKTRKIDILLQKGKSRSIFGF